MLKVLVICLAAVLMPLGVPATQADMPGAISGSAPVTAQVFTVDSDEPTAVPTAVPTAAPSSPFTVVFTTMLPAVSPSALPGKAAYAFRSKGELMQVQRKLALAGYYGGDQTADSAATGEMDEPTRKVIRAYLSVVRSDPKWTRDYLTEEEYRQFVQVGNFIATPTPPPQAGFSTPQPTSIVLVDAPPADALAAQGSTAVTPAVEPMGVFTHGDYGELAPPPPAALTPIPTATLAPTPSPTAQPTPVPIVFSNIRYSRKRADELFVHGRVSTPGATVELTDAAEQLLDTAAADHEGVFSLHVEGIKPTGQQAVDKLFLEVKARKDSRQTLAVSNVEQHTLFAFTRSLDSTDLLVVGAVLLGLSAALLALFAISTKSKKAHNSTGNKSNAQGGSST